MTKAELIDKLEDFSDDAEVTMYESSIRLCTSVGIIGEDGKNIILYPEP
jgi:hypothetical protein